MTNSLLLKMAIEIVDCPMKNGDFPFNGIYTGLMDFPMNNADFP